MSGSEPTLMPHTCLIAGEPSHLAFVASAQRGENEQQNGSSLGM